MFEHFTKSQIAGLNERSIWIIMDPWEDQERLFPGRLSPNTEPGLLNRWNKITMDKILTYLPQMEYPMVVTTEIDKSPAVFQKLPYIQHHPKNAGPYLLARYMDKHDLNNIIYCGFHENECIVNRPTGYNRMSSVVDCYICKDLTCVYPLVGWKETVTRQRRSPDYKYFNLI